MAWNGGNISITISLIHLIWIYGVFIVLYLIFISTLFLLAIKNKKMRNAIKDLKFSQFFLGLLISPYIIIVIVIPGLYANIKEFSFKQWRLNQKWYRKFKKGEYFYIETSNGWVWKKGTPTEFEKPHIYEVHTKNKSYVNKINWPEEGFPESLGYYDR